MAGELGVGAGNPLAEAVSALYERCPDVLRKAWASERRVVRHLYINAMPYCELHNNDHFLHLNLNWSPFSHQLTLIAEVSAVWAVIVPSMPYTLSVRPLVPVLTRRETRLLMLVDAVILGLASRLTGWLAGWLTD